MSSTDNRIVRMVFDNAAFKRAAAETKSALTSVNDAITRAGQSKGLLNLNKNMKDVAINASKMQVATAAAIGTISSKATLLGLSVAKSLAFDPIKQGFQEYESLLTKQNTIMNATGKSAKQVKRVLNELNTYSDKTIYSFGDMTSAITKFVNAGVPLGQATESIRGIANAAAFGGASAEEAGRAMYAFSQSMSLGFIGLQDWMQIENANMGTIRFKEEIIKAGLAVGTLTEKSGKFYTKSGKVISATKGWRDGLKQQWATTEVLNKALGKYADTTTKLGKKAFQSATEVRTFSAFMSTLKESIGSGWGQVFGALIGGLDESTKNWTALSQAVGGVVSGFFSFVTSALTTWRTLGGFTKTIQGFKNILSPFVALFKAVGDAWKAAFPDSGKGSGSALYGLSVAFELLTRPLTWLAWLISQLVHPLTIFFQLIHLEYLIVGRLIGYIGDFWKGVFGLLSLKAPSGDGAGTFLGWLKRVVHEVERAIGVVVSLLEEGASLKDAFKALGHIDLKFPALPELPDWMKGVLPNKISLPGLGGFNLPKIGSIFGGGGKDKGASNIETMSTSVMDLVSNVTDLDYVMKGLSENSILGGTGQGEFKGVVNLRQLEQGTQIATDMMSNAKDAGESFWDVIKRISSAIGDFFGKINGEDIIHGLNFALLGTMGLTAAKMFSNFSNVLGGVSDVIKGFKKVGPAMVDTLKGAGSALKSFQTQARAELIKQIGIAILILAAALLILSFIPRDKMMTALMGLGGAIAGLILIMIVFTKTMDKLDKDKVTRKMYALGFAMMAIGLGILFLAAAMLIMNHVDVKSLAKTAFILGVLFVGLNQIGKLAEKSGRKLIAAGIAIGLIGASLIVLATALLLFKLVDWESMKKAGAVITVLVAALLLLGLVPAARLAKAGTAILAISVAMLLLANALIIFGTVKWESIGKAAVMLAALSISLLLMSAGGVQGAAVILAMGAAMLAIAMACLIFNKVNWKSIAMAAVVLGLIVLAFAAMLAIITVFAPAVALLTTLALGLAALAAAAALLAFAFAIILPLLAVGAAAFAAFAAAAAVAIAVFLQTLATEMPTIKSALLKIIKYIGETVVEATPIVIEAIIGVIKAITKKIPDYVKAGVELIAALIRGIGSQLSGIVSAAVDLIIAFVNGLADNSVKLVRAAVDLVAKLAKGLLDNVLVLTNAAIDLVIGFLHGLADTIRSNSGPMGQAIGDVVAAMAEMGPRIVAGLVKGILDHKGDLIDGVKDLIGSIPIVGNSIMKILSPSRVMITMGKFIVLGLVVGIQNHAAAAITAVASMVSGQIAIASEYISAFVQKLDQQAIAARAKAEGLAAAAERAAAAAEKTKKNKKDDAEAEKLGKQAEAEATRADKLEERANKARDRANRNKEFAEASTLDKAKMKSEDAQTALDDAKAAEGRAAKASAEARALEAQIKTNKYSEAEERRMRKEADRLRGEAKKEAELANAYYNTAKTNTAAALALQKQAGAEAAAAYQKQFEDAARADAEQDAFNALNDTDKAVKRRADAAALQAQAADNLAKAKKLAYTDVEAANELAQAALDQADQARQYLKDAVGYEQAVADAARQAADAAAGVTPTPVETTPTVTPTVDLTASDQAALAFSNLADLYNSATAAAAAGSKLEFNQYNTSPESLTPTEVYRQTNNLLTHAYDKLGKAA